MRTGLLWPFWSHLLGASVCFSPAHSWSEVAGSRPMWISYSLQHVADHIPIYIPTSGILFNTWCHQNFKFLQIRESQPGYNFLWSWFVFPRWLMSLSIFLYLCWPYVFLLLCLICSSLLPDSFLTVILSPFLNHSVFDFYSLAFGFLPLPWTFFF